MADSFKYKNANNEWVELQNKLVSGTDIKTVNSTSLLGSGNISIPVVSVSQSGTATDEVQYITIDGVEKKLAGGGSGAGTWSELQGKPFSTIDTTTLVVNDGVLAVNTADAATIGNVKPITSNAVKNEINTAVGNIEILLATI